MWEWSRNLQAQLEELSPQQQRAIVLILMAEVKGEPITRLLKTSYSCQWCGQVIGHAADGRAARKIALAEHERDCRLGPAQKSESARPWRFAASLVTFYTRWKLPGSTFEQCLNQARREIRSNALQRATWILQLGAPEAALELKRQITLASDESNRRLAAVAVLDRVNLEAIQGDGDREDNLDSLDDETLRAEEARLARLLTAGASTAAAGATEAAGPEK